MVKKSILLWGGGLRGLKIYNYFKSNKAFLQKNIRVKYIFDPSKNKLSFENKAIFSNKKSTLNKAFKECKYFLVAIGSNLGKARYLISLELMKKGLIPLEYIHKEAFIDKSSKIGKGIQTEPRAVIQGNCKIGDFCIINTNSTIDHGSSLGNGCHIMSGAVICGDVKIDDFVTVGANATILPYVKIETGAYIGAGSVVTKNVKKNEVIIGNPGRKIKYHKHKFDISMFKSK